MSAPLLLLARRGAIRAHRVHGSVAWAHLAAGGFWLLRLSIRGVRSTATRARADDLDDALRTLWSWGAADAARSLLRYAASIGMVSWPN